MKDPMDNKLDNTVDRPVEPPHDIAQPHPKRDEAMQVFENLMKHRRMGVSVDIGNISSMLNQRNPVTKFPEALFIQHFLPLFSGEVEQTDSVNYLTWVENIAGGMDMPVEIVGDDGTVLYTIPPIFDSSVLERHIESSRSMTLIERQYSRLKEFDAAGSQVFLQKMLTSTHIKDKPTESVYENIRTWNDIFKRYGKEDKIIDLLNLENAPNKDKPSTVLPEDSIGEYELDTD